MTALTERDWQSRVVDLARLRRWLVFHDHDSRRNPAGLPDLLMVRDGVMIAAELKAERGRVRPEQQVWLDALDRVPGVTAVVWKPEQWPTVVEALT